jgi:hypothetical protein
MPEKILKFNEPSGKIAQIFANIVQTFPFLW